MKILYKLFYKINRARWYLTRPITLGVRALLIHGEELVLVRHTYTDGWYLPGGGVKRGETLEQAIRREVAEETGIRIDALDLFGVYSNFYEAKSDHVVLFLSKAFTMESGGDAEIERCALWSLAKLPPDTSAGTRRRIAEYRQGARAIYGRW